MEVASGYQSLSINMTDWLVIFPTTNFLLGTNVSD